MTKFGTSVHSVVTDPSTTWTDSPETRGSTGALRTVNRWSALPVLVPSTSRGASSLCSAVTDPPTESTRISRICGDARYVGWPGSGSSMRARSQ